MLIDRVVPAEAARYAASLVFIPGLWAPSGVWQGFATFLAHRGWECRLLEMRGAGSLGVRAAAVRAYVAALPGRVVLVGHDAGALVALSAAVGEQVAAAVLVAPLVPGSPPVRALTLAPRNLLRVAFGRPVPPPRGRGAALAFGGAPGPVPPGLPQQLGPDDAIVVRDIALGRAQPVRTSVPTLLVVGDRDPLLAVARAQAMAELLGADVCLLEATGHWPLAGPTWQRAAGAVHRWLVQRLGESLLEFYAEAMAEREAEEDDEG